MPETVHVLPVNDLIEHDDEGTECACGPTIEPVLDRDGACGWVITHHSLDGRENHEPKPHTINCNDRRYCANAAITITADDPAQAHMEARRRGWLIHPAADQYTCPTCQTGKHPRRTQ